jgi:nickel-dependent lactate racemase
MIFFSEGNKTAIVSSARISELVDLMIGKLGKLSRVLLIPPDYTRSRSFAGEITNMLYHKLKDRSEIRILPALGTHAPMTSKESNAMFPGIPDHLFLRHDWKDDVVRLGTVTPEILKQLTGGLAEFSVHCEISRIVAEGDWDQIISIGQLVPHELVGIANHNKNVLIGAGGRDIIGKTHFIGALYGSERMMGHIESPVRKVLDYMSGQYLSHLPVSYILTVRDVNNDNHYITRGIFAGDDKECYLKGAELCRQVNIHPLKKQYGKVVAWLDPGKFKSTWVGNKAIYRTRMAVANGGELIILCPGIRCFGEDPLNDAIIRKYGYRDKETLLNIWESEGKSEDDLTPLSHLIISSPENRFRITYAAANISKSELESVNCHHADYFEMIKRYDPDCLKEGENILPDGEEIFFIPEPAQGLWSGINEFNKYAGHD